MIAAMSHRYLLVLAAASALACAKQNPAPEASAEKPAVAETDAHDQFAKVKVDDVERLLNAKQAVPVDANDGEIREQLGTLPGAILLSNARTFEAKELPQDKSTELIFYCGSEKCMSAPKAAARAKEAGYSSVKVMPAGIRGWVRAGKPVDRS
jgi:rhodanese-related sulfurtransferase